MPVDKSAIKTQLGIHPDLFHNPESFIRKHDLPIRTLKQTRGRSVNGSTKILTLDVLTYKGIKVRLTKSAGTCLTRATIHFNPGVCLYGHNGRVLSLTEFLEALALLVTHLNPLLKDPDDWVDLIPGLRKGGRAYWSYLEVFSHWLDLDGSLLAGFRHARHPSITTPTRHWPTSIQMGGARSILQFSIYQKAHEMVIRNKLPPSELPTFKDVLRLEARMSDEKLARYFGNDRNVDEIVGEKRLCRFFPQDIIGGHRMSFSEMKGVAYSPAERSKETVTMKPNQALGKLLAIEALDSGTSQTLPELLSHFKFYTGASTVTIGEIRKAALAELERRSSLSFDDLFSEAAYRAQPEITIPDLEQKVCRPLEDMHLHPLITAAYRPPDPLFHPNTEGPRYIRSKPRNQSRK